MLFNSFPFLLLFLPLCLFGFLLSRQYKGKAFGIKFLTLSSLFFYGWWNPHYLLLIIGSIAFNYCMGQIQIASVERTGYGNKGWLSVGIAVNIGLLVYFKYFGFFTSVISSSFSLGWTIPKIILPLAISFFTFTQISYLVDCYAKKISHTSVSDYCFFVLFFPHLIAGPVVRAREILPQIAESSLTISKETVIEGMTVFIAGLAKKSLLADSIAPLVTSGWSTLHSSPPALFNAWLLIIAYALQLYFDFSGYSDMAIGLAYMFGIRLPLNFNSPYKSLNIIDFWKRWHISLSRFLKDYLYIPLGGNRYGVSRKYANLMITMGLGGLWHGAGWNFLIWGLLHGLFLTVNHGWRNLTKGAQWPHSPWLKPVWWGITFSCVLVGWVYFRSPTYEVANQFVAGMFGLNGVSLPLGFSKLVGGTHLQWLSFNGVGMTPSEAAFVIAMLVIAVCTPNTQEIFHRIHPAYEAAEKPALVLWDKTLVWGMVIGLIFSFSLMRLNDVSEFLYFQF